MVGFHLSNFCSYSSQRTKVIDDESDYYQSNSVWLSKAEKERLRKREEEIQAQKHRSRLDRKVTLDFAGREVIDEEFYIEEEDINNFMDRDEFKNNNTCPTVEFDRPTVSNKNKFIIIFSIYYSFIISFQYVELNLWPQNPNNRPNLIDTKNRIQDKEYLEMSDEGYCLSMHQPYASLLVAGIKT